MVAPLSGGESLDRLFAALTEHTFQSDLGIADPPLTDYLSKLLLRFMRVDAIYRVRDVEGNCLREVVDMLEEAEARQAKPQREAFRHIGDFTLFWTGVYPEALSRLQGPDSKDQLIDYRAQGKRSYLRASTFDEEPFRSEAAVLRRLSDEFELCMTGLNRVRAEWEKLPAELAEDADRN